jgi:uncharacterized protein (DUF1778 family)
MSKGGKRQNSGRKKLGIETSTLSIDIPKESHDAIREKAKEKGLSITSFILSIFYG